jgi:nucleotide-binding universal stress UspA family protein
MNQPLEYQRALQDFRTARRKAQFERALSRFTKVSPALLSYEEVKKMLKGHEVGLPEIREIPLDSIVGSVGRFADFSSTFLPKAEINEERWAKVKVAMTTGTGVPPIEVYQIGEAYFVLDGNHRVSIARSLKMKFIEAYVHEIKTKATFSPEDGPDDLIVKAEFTNFLSRTRLDHLRPEANLEATVCGIYSTVDEHIATHRYFMGIDQGREISYEEALGHWYDVVYLPVVQTIRSLNLLGEFPGRTETDLYVWLSKHRAALSEALDWEIDLDEAAADLIEDQDHDSGILSKIADSLATGITPDLEDRPVDRHRAGRMFRDIFVPITGRDSGWVALAQAAELAGHESRRLRGLHIVNEGESETSAQAQAIEQEFKQRCASYGVEGDFAVESGKIAIVISDRAQWADLVVLHVAHPPPEKALASLSSGLRTLIQRCPRPILAVKNQISHFKKLLIAFDGSPKAREALYVASYLSGKMGLQVTVVSVLDSGNNPQESLSTAQQYLGLCGCEGNLIETTGKVADAVLETAEHEFCDLILMGGYSHAGVVEAVLGSAVDQVLRTSRIPVLICH